MSLLVDHQIRRLAEEQGMVVPYLGGQTRSFRDSERHVERKVLSFGQSSAGLDIRIANDFKIFSPAQCAVVDPKKFTDDAFVSVKAKRDEADGSLYVLIPPNSFLLGRSIERFKIPRDVLAIIIGKSTLARCGLIINMTPAEPGWEGHLTIEVSNTTPLPVKLYAEEGVCQVLFFRTEQPCTTSYKDRKGKYDNQGPEVVLPRL